MHQLLSKAIYGHFEATFTGAGCRYGAKMKLFSLFLSALVMVLGGVTSAETVEVEMILHPCRAPSTPYRKYKGFAIPASRDVLLKFKNEKSNPKIERKSYVSVEEFFVDKGLLATVASGGYVLGPQCQVEIDGKPARGEPYVKATLTASYDSSKTGKGDRGGNGKKGGDNGSSGKIGEKRKPSDKQHGEADHLRKITPLEDSILGYYGISAEEDPFCGLFDSYMTHVELFQQQAEDIKAHLHQVLSQSHVQQANQPDRMIPSCEKVKKASECEDPKDEECQDKDVIVLKSGESCLTPIVFTYRAARRLLFGKLHLKKDEQGYVVRDVYCQKYYRQEDFGSSDGPGEYKIPFHQILNAEHTWPQSRFNFHMTDRQLVAMKTDLHHLFPSDSLHNSTRGNFQFGEVAGEENELSCAGNRRGQAELNDDLKKKGFTESEATYYEPPDAHKGNVARALFYFSVRYKAPIAPLEEAFLRQWHKQDPVDEFEYQRNAEIYKLQGTRNPFIDFEGLVETISDF